MDNPKSDPFNELSPQNDEEALPGEAAPVVDEDISTAQWQELKIKAAKADENWERLVRMTADFDNYKKRALRERQEAVKYANESLLEKLIPVLDTFDMALTAANTGAPDKAENLQSLVTGINMIKQQLKQVLSDSGMEEIDASKGPFDPNFHEAVSQQESKEVSEGHILQQIRKGYKLRDRLVRPAGVVVAKNPAKA